MEQCIYDPDRNSLRTRVIFNDMSVSGMVSLMPRNHRALISAESCTMTLRLRRAGIDFLTSPIARGHGQMRIRTESSFLEPRFASIYAYGCRSTRIDKQIKRQDKWPPYHLATVNKVGQIFENLKIFLFFCKSKKKVARTYQKICLKNVALLLLLF